MVRIEYNDLYYVFDKNNKIGVFSDLHNAEKFYNNYLKGISMIEDSRPYKLFTGLIDYEGFYELENTIGNIEFNRVDIGLYRLRNNNFIPGKTFIMVFPHITEQFNENYRVMSNHININDIYIIYFENNNPNERFDITPDYPVYIEIRVYK